LTIADKESLAHCEWVGIAKMSNECPSPVKWVEST